MVYTPEFLSFVLTPTVFVHTVYCQFFVRCGPLLAGEKTSNSPITICAKETESKASRPVWHYFAKSKILPRILHCRTHSFNVP